MDDLIDLDALKTSAAAMLASECSRETVLRHSEGPGGPLAPLWQTATELGWMALPVSEDHGGLSLGIDALALIYTELGRMVAPLPYLTTMLVAQAIQLGGSEAQQADYLPRLASGTIATLTAPLAVGKPELHIAFDGDELILSGQAAHLLDGRDADIILLLAMDDAGQPYRVIVNPQDNIMIDSKRLWDPAHSLASIPFNNMRLPRERGFASDSRLEGELLVHASVGLAAEAVGGSEGILAMTIDYLKTRQQFGKPIGSFQALKHRVADHQTRVVAARALLKSAVAKATALAEDRLPEASAAKALACSVYAELARDSIQLHGGIGFTAEYACHLYLKRAHLIANLFGDEGFHIRQSAKPHFVREAA